jgi:hypothetical protein
MNPKRVFIIAGITAVIYAAVAVWVLNNFEIPPIKGAAWIFLVVAVICQISAMWFFGLLFREAIQEVGGSVRRRSAFKAAMVGAGVA